MQEKKVNVGNVPNLRFPGFEGLWTDGQLGDIGDIRMCKRIFNEETSVTGEVPFYKIGSFGKKADAFISRKTYLEYKQKFSFPSIGNILISAAGTIGRTVVYNGEDAYFQDSNIVWIDNDNSSIKDEFLFYILHIVKFNTEGGTIQRLYNNILKSTTFSYPGVIEQNRIVKFLMLIDKRIQTQSKIIEGLKSSMLKISVQIFEGKYRFQKNGEKFFPAWRNVMVRELGNFIGGGTPSTGKEEFWNGEIPWISSSDLNSDSIHEINISRFITEEAVKKSATKIIPAKSVLLVSRVGVGKVAVNESRLCTSQDFTTLIPYEDNYVFLGYMLKFHANRLLSFNQGTSIKGFVKKELEELEVSLPVKEEQELIAQLLSRLDLKIKTEKQILSLYQSQKVSLLKDLFV